jgi:hypothetical protein
MAGTVQVEVARTIERDELLEVLRAHGLDARPSEGDELGIEISCETDEGDTCDEVIADVEAFIAAAGLPLVPVRTDGAVFVRPPAS